MFYAFLSLSPGHDHTVVQLQMPEYKIITKHAVMNQACEVHDRRNTRGRVDLRGRLMSQPLG